MTAIKVKVFFALVIHKAMAFSMTRIEIVAGINVV